MKKKNAKRAAERRALNKRYNEEKRNYKTLKLSDIPTELHKDIDDNVELFHKFILVLLKTQSDGIDGLVDDIKSKKCNIKTLIEIFASETNLLLKSLLNPAYRNGFQVGVDKIINDAATEGFVFGTDGVDLYKLPASGN